MESAEISVRWSNHSDALSSVCKNMFDDNFLVDCTVCAEGQCLKAHRLILSACSPYFQLMFKQDNEKHPIIFLKDTKFVELKALIDFVYCGETQIPEDCVGTFFQLAQSLQIKGLIDTEQCNMSKVSAKFASRISNPSLSSNFVSEDFANDPRVSPSNYVNSEGFENKTNVVQPNNSSTKNSLKLQPSYSLDVPAKLVKHNSSFPSEECNNFNYGQINCPLVMPQQSLSSTVERHPCVENAVKSEPNDFENLEPKFHESDVEIDSQTSDDFPEIDAEQEEITFGHQTENVKDLTKECHEFSYGEVTPLVTQQQPLFSPSGMPPWVEEAIKCEPNETEILEPKFEETGVEMNTANAIDYSENDSKHLVITSGYQTENVKRPELVQPDTSLPSEERNDFNCGQVNCPLVTPQQPLSPIVERSPWVGRAVKR